MTTPEGRVKVKVRELLAQYDGMYLYWPVPGGFGNTTLDCLGCYRMLFFSIETKRPKNKPTLRQMNEIHNIERAMGKTFVIIGEDSPVFDELRAWLDMVTKAVPYDPHLTPDPVARRTI